jgi:hypothetical protein
MNEEISYLKSKLNEKKNIIKTILPAVDNNKIPKKLPITGTSVFYEVKSKNGTSKLSRMRIGDDLLCGRTIEEYLCFREHSEQEWLEKERREQESREFKRREQERLEKERREQKRLEKERREQERLEKERREQERREKERLEQDRLEKERREQDRLVIELLEQERRELERSEQERLEKERREKEPRELEREQKRLELERREQESREIERLEHERKEHEKKRQVQQLRSQGCLKSQPEHRGKYITLERCSTDKQNQCENSLVLSPSESPSPLKLPRPKGRQTRNSRKTYYIKEVG